MLTWPLPEPEAGVGARAAALTAAASAAGHDQGAGHNQQANALHLFLPSSHGRTTDLVRCCGRSGSRPRDWASATAVRWSVTSSAIGSAPTPRDGRARDADRRGKVGVGNAKEPHQRARACDADRPVAVLHPGICLGPCAARLPELQGGLEREPDAPAVAQEHEVLELGQGRLVAARRATPRRCDRGPRSWPSAARISASIVVANRVWTIDSSSANGSRMASLAASTTGVAGTAEIASDGVPAGSAVERARRPRWSCPSARSPARRHTCRVVGISEATNASLSPWPADSRATATDWAM